MLILSGFCEKNYSKLQCALLYIFNVNQFLYVNKSL